MIPPISAPPQTGTHVLPLFSVFVKHPVVNMLGNVCYLLLHHTTATEPWHLMLKCSKLLFDTMSICPCLYPMGIVHYPQIKAGRLPSFPSFTVLAWRHK